MAFAINFELIFQHILYLNLLFRLKREMYTCRFEIELLTDAE
jgi:hypothetical protein